MKKTFRNYLIPVKLGLLLHFIISNGLSQNCDYYEYLKTGVTYYVHNPDYPYASNGQRYCKWTAESDYRMKLTCKSFNIPWSNGCYNRLNVYVNNSMPFYYCGDRPFTVESTGKWIKIELSTAYSASNVKFICELQTIEDCECGWKNPTKIVGGVETGVNEYPMMAALVDARNKFDPQFCGACIISRKHALSAAHCVINKDKTSTLVLVGDHDLSTGADTKAATLHTVLNFDIHPSYNPGTSVNDIAIVTVNPYIEFNLKVGPACLPFSYAYESFEGEYVDLLGWGLLHFGGKKSNTLQKTTLRVLTNRQCRQSYPNLSDGQLCTYAAGKDACQMDSGGPVLLQNPATRRVFIVGIISYGTACASNIPGVNTRVSAYLNWIIEKTGMGYCNAK